VSAAKTAAVAIATAAFALLSGALFLAPLAHATFRGRNGQIAYGLYSNSEGEEGPEVFPLGIEAIRLGHPSRRSLLLTQAPPLVPSDCIEAPSYSPDGKLIAFDARWGSVECEPYPAPPEPLSPAKNIFIMSASGGEVRQVTKEPHVEDSDPGFSPSGDQIVFSRSANRQTQIYTINTDGSGLHQLTTGRADRVLNPRYSPDGKHIIFDSKKGIEELNRNGSGRHLLAADHGRYRVAEADFSPNGKLITFVKATGTKTWIYIARANGKAARRISPPASLAVGSYCFHSFCAPSPIFSPDGKRILFVVFRGNEGSKLVAVPVAGRLRKVKPIISRDFAIVRPSWQPLP
jgi:TolB protein